MNKCPQCLCVLSITAEVCPKCGYSLFEDIKSTLPRFGVDEEEATRLLTERSMTPEKWQKIKELFAQAEDLPSGERETFLKKACGDDRELRSAVERLLASAANADPEFLEEPVVKEAPSMFEVKETQLLDHTTGKVNDGKFVAGTVLENRYRIIGLLGKGGMGEVYRAEDLKLDQVVALKFLPEKLEKNPQALERFIGEVRTARQVSHPNVCKVYDISEAHGKHFLSMEYIDGDDLSHLLRRIGRLPSDKAAEISRQLCFGLHAIHDAGILHRDLKPANIIIDSNGKARITDFGIAGIEADISNDEVRVGTPAYMSPEQITGKEVTQKSDIYSLGLLLYEIYTGKQAIRANSFEELVEKQQTTQPTNPSTFVENIEPIVEKTISRCLEKDPNDRPASALQVALSLPGGNPLEAAIAAGETPSPEMVAAAPKKGALKFPVALGLLATLIIVFASVIYVYQDLKTYMLTPFEKSPEILAERSREFLKKTGFDEASMYSNYKFVQDDSFIDYHSFRKTERNADLPSRKEMLRKAGAYNYYFLYRRSPRELEPVESVFISENEPPLSLSNMANLKLDARGNLFEFIAVPDQTVTAGSTGKKVDWKLFFDEAGLDIAKFQKTESQWTPPVFADERQAWKGTLADFPNVPIRIETAEFNGKPVYFKIVNLWDVAERETVSSQNVYRKYGTIFLIIVVFFAIAGSTFFAYRNLRDGRGDLRGGLKLILFVFAVTILSQMISGDHVPTLWGELSVIYEGASYAIILAVMTGLLYIAIEPFVRRNWPETLISWSRVMKGDFRDPMVGRDILGGGACGVGHTAGILYNHVAVQSYLGNYEFVNQVTPAELFNGTSELFSFVLFGSADVVLQSLFVLFIAFVFYRLTGSKFLGALSIGIISFIAMSLFFVLTIHPILVFFSFFMSVLYVVSLWRFGLLGFVANMFFFYLTYLIPYTFDTSAFYFSTSVIAMIIVLVLAFYAFYISIAGKSGFGGNTAGEFSD
ncbi:MAG: protein kinase [Pyrinomonadaceae bacterium]